MDGRKGNVEMTDLLAEVNARVRELADAQSEGTAEWDFRCECGEPDCRESVSLTVAGYELLRAGGSPILAPGHERSRFRAAREVARAIREESVALRQQARLQAERARRNGPCSSAARARLWQLRLRRQRRAAARRPLPDVRRL